MEFNIPIASGEMERWSKLMKSNIRQLSLTTDLSTARQWTQLLQNLYRQSQTAEDEIKNNQKTALAAADRG